ncbi:MAG: TatD family hydrolase [Eggerthellaceae bacterium]|nr:TatD family hydrolase [Eggerthellaceae bacterium]
MDNHDNVIFRDLLFRKKIKKGKFANIDDPVAVFPISDTHAHPAMFKDPAFALARATANKVTIIGCISDPISDGEVLFDNWEAWRKEAVDILRTELGRLEFMDTEPSEMFIELGVHPHSSCDWNDDFEKRFLELARDQRVRAIGEIGLDFHYDFSTLDEQIFAFERQLEIARVLNFPVCLHIRDAHRKAIEIIKALKIPGKKVLLHCCSLPPRELKPWLDLDCYVAYGGILTFKKLEKAREGAKLVPLNRLLLETDAPFMAPEPMRGICCTPDHVLYTAACLADLRGFTIDKLQKRKEFFNNILENTKRFFQLN